MSRIGIRAALAAGALGLPCLLACGGTAAPGVSRDSPAAAFGTLSMPLASNVNGVGYRLTTDSFSLSGPIEADLQHNGDGSIVVATLPEGDYEVTLHDGWQLERQTASGYEAIAADLASPNPRPVHIEGAQTTQVAWLFETDAGPVGPGLLQGILHVADSTNPTTTILGDVLATETEHVRAIAGIANIDGSLSIDGSVPIDGGIRSLMPLSSLTLIDDDLIISNTQLTSLAGLDNLIEVGGALVITGNARLPTCAIEALLARIGVNSWDADIFDNDDAGVCP